MTAHKAKYSFIVALVITSLLLVNLPVVALPGLSPAPSSPGSTLWHPPSSPQTPASSSVLLNSNFDSGSFAGDGWTEVNGTQTNQWYVGTAAGSSAGATGNAAYISNDGGVTNAYTVTAASVVHFFQDVSFPAGENVILLTFDLKGIGESTFDRVKVYLVPTTTLPVSGTELSTGQIGRSAGYNLQSGYTRFGIWLPASAAGTTQRLVFSWRNDASVGTPPPRSTG